MDTASKMVAWSPRPCDSAESPPLTQSDADGRSSALTGPTQQPNAGPRKGPRGPTASPRKGYWWDDEEARASGCGRWGLPVFGLQGCYVFKKNHRVRK